MPRMVSPAGDMEIGVSSATVIDDQLVVTGKFGVWDSKIYVTRAEAKEIMMMMMKGNIISFALKTLFTRARK